MSTVRILALSGSTRSGSLNGKALTPAIDGALSTGASVTLLDLSEYPLPLYQGDLETVEGVPQNARKLQNLFHDHDALIIASPEYNGLPTPLLINILAWISRDIPDGTRPFHEKLAAILSASPGALGGLRGLLHLRTLLNNIGIIVLPNQIALSSAHQWFDKSGLLTNDEKRAQLEELGQSLAKAAQKMIAV